MRIAVEEVIAEDDKVVVRYTAIATDTEGFMGRPPTGKRIRTPAILIFRLAEMARSWRAGRCATTWGRYASSVTFLRSGRVAEGTISRRTAVGGTPNTKARPSF